MPVMSGYSRQPLVEKTTPDSGFMHILHTSDWHLGRQFHTIFLPEDPHHILQQIKAIIRERQWMWYWWR
jgi:hypothetical protein